MCDSNMEGQLQHYSPRASLVALALKLVQLDLLGPLRTSFKLAQKTIKYSPYHKLLTAFIAILAGAAGLVEINKLVRADSPLYAAFGLKGCPDQSGVQTTLNHCGRVQLEQIQQATKAVFQKHSQAYQHPYAQKWQVLDCDISGLPCGKKAALATKGYFAKLRNRRGRQLGRVLASWYKEIVLDRLFAGTVQLQQALPQLVEETEAVLELTQARRKRTIWRVDSGGGSLTDLNWLLGRDYQLIGKDYSEQRARRLCQSVKGWVDDPRHGGRQVGWIEEEPDEYVRPVKRVGVRCRKKNGQWGYAVIISSLPSLVVLELSGQEVGENNPSPSQVLLAYAYFYDQRGGGVECEFKEDKQGLGLSSRNKKSFEGQAIVVELSALAHNVLLWGQGWLAQSSPKLKQFGIKRLVRDIFAISGMVRSNAAGRIYQISLNAADSYARFVVGGLAELLFTLQVDVNLRQT